MNQRMLLMSSSRQGQLGYLEHADAQIHAVLKHEPLKVLFVPFAAVTFGFDTYEGMVKPVFEFSKNMDAVLALMDKYRQVPMSLADACLVRMTELLNDPVVLTTDHDFRIYRRHGRQIVPAVLPSQ